MSELELDPEQFGPGSYGMHELLHLVSVFECVWEDHVVKHPSAQLHAELLEKAEAIGEAIADLYQLIGTKHCENDSNGGS